MLEIVLGTPKTVISKLITTGKLRPHIFPIMVTPTMFQWDKKSLGEKKLGAKKSLPQKCINSFLAHKYLTIARYGFFGALTGPYPMLQFGGAEDWGWGCSNEWSILPTIIMYEI